MGFLLSCRSLLSIFINKILSHVFQSWKCVVKSSYWEVYSTGFISLAYLSYLVVFWVFCGSGETKVYDTSDWNAALRILKAEPMLSAKMVMMDALLICIPQKVAGGIRRWQFQSLTHHHICSVALLCLTSFW